MLIKNPQQSNMFACRATIQKESSKTSDVSSGKLVSNPIRKTSDTNFVAYPLVNFTGLNKQKSRQEQGREIANGLHNSLKSTVGAIDNKKFKNEFNKIDKTNVIPTIKSYDKLFPKNTLISDILTETGTDIETRENTVKNLFNILAETGKDNGVQVEHFKKNFDEELTRQVNKPVFSPKPTKLNRITNGLVQAIENKSSLTKEEKLAIAKSKPEKFYDYTTQLLESNLKVAEKSFQERVDSDGFFGKIADNVSAIWNSKNRKKLVQEDIDKHKDEIACLRAVADKGDDEFREVFKTIFKVDYDPELVATYKNKEVQLKTSLVAIASENFFNDKLSDLINNKKLEDKYEMLHTVTCSAPVINKIETKEEMYQRNYNNFSMILGKGDKKKGSEILESKFKAEKLKPDATLKDKYKVMVKLANSQSDQMHKETMKITGGKDISLVKKEFEASYNATFGVENDIAKRVTDYNISQEVGEYAADCLIMGPIMIGVSLATGSGVTMASAVKGALAATGTNMVAYSADRLASKKGMTKEDIQDILKFSVLDGSTFVASALASTGINYFTSAAFKGASVGKKATEIAMLTLAETTADATVQKVLYGNVKIDGVKYSATFSLAGQLLELKLLK